MNRGARMDRDEIEISRTITPNKASGRGLSLYMEGKADELRQQADLLAGLAAATRQTAPESHERDAILLALRLAGIEIVMVTERIGPVVGTAGQFVSLPLDPEPPKC